MTTPAAKEQGTPREHCPDYMRPMDKSAAEDFLGEVFHGIHHIPGDLKPFGNGWKISAYSSRLSSYDFDSLTRLVLLAHDRCVRVEIVQGGPARVGIVIHQRRKRDGSMFERHPTIEQALAKWREEFPSSTVTP